MTFKNKLVKVNDDRWSLLKTYASIKKLPLHITLDEILKEKLEPVRKALEGL